MRRRRPRRPHGTLCVRAGRACGTNEGARVDTLIESLPGNLLTIAKILGGLIGAYLFLIWVASLFWAYRDMRSRTRDFVTQLAGVSVLVFLPLIGYPVYLAVRPSQTLREAYDRQLEQEAILSELHSAPACPECRASDRRRVDDLRVLQPCAEAALPELRTPADERLAALPVLRRASRAARSGPSSRGGGRHSGRGRARGQRGRAGPPPAPRCSDLSTGGRGGAGGRAPSPPLPPGGADGRETASGPIGGSAPGQA